MGQAEADRFQVNLLYKKIVVILKLAFIQSRIFPTDCSPIWQVLDQDAAAPVCGKMSRLWPKNGLGLFQTVAQDWAGWFLFCPCQHGLELEADCGCI